MSTVEFLLTLLLGGIGGIALRAGHERTERVRDRLLEAAEKFLAAQEGARAAFDPYRQRTSEDFLARTKQAASETAEVAVVQKYGAGPVNDARQRVHAPLAHLLPRLRGRFNEGWDVIERERLLTELAAAHERLATEFSTGNVPADVRDSIEQTLSDVEVWIRTSDEQQAAYGEWERRTHDLREAVARVVVVYSPRRRLARKGWRFSLAEDPSGAVTAAFATMQAWAEAGTHVSNERNAGRDPGISNADVTAAETRAVAAVIPFAKMTNKEVRRLWL